MRRISSDSKLSMVDILFHLENPIFLFQTKSAKVYIEIIVQVLVS